MRRIFRFIVAITICGSVLFPNVVWADTINKPYTFAAGNVANASEVNSNFDLLYDQVNKIGTMVNIDSVNSRVGIGTAFPASTLDVSGSTTIRGPIILRSGDTNNIIDRNQILMQYHRNGSGGHAIKTQHNTGPGYAHRNAIDFYLWQEGDADDQPSKHVLRLRGNGRVGIGTANPQSTLDVSGSTNITGAATITGSTTLGETLNVKWGNTNGDTGRNQILMQYYTGNGGHAIKTQHNTGPGYAHRNAVDFYLWQEGDADDQPSKHILRLRGDGKVGVNTLAPSRDFFVNGDAGGNSGWYTDSDRRLKTNIRTIEGALDKVERLRGVQFQWNDTNNRPEGFQMGFIAQEAIDIVPEVIDKEDEYYSMQYAPLTALLVEAVKELKAENDELKKMKTEYENLKRIICEEFPEKSICEW